MKKSLIVSMWLCCYVAMLLVGSVFAQETPTLTIVSPRENETIFGSQAAFSFFTSNFFLGIDGYLRVSFDQKEPLTIKEQKDLSLTHLSEGKHILIAELVDKKNQPLSPVVKKRVVFISSSLKEKKGINLEISPAETRQTKILLPLFLTLLAFGAVVLLVLAFKFYINTKAGQNGAHQKPLG